MMMEMHNASNVNTHVMNVLIYQHVFHVEVLIKDKMPQMDVYVKWDILKILIPLIV